MPQFYDSFGVEDVLLIKEDGTRHNGRVHAQEKLVLADQSFPVAHGDVIERTLPSGIVQRYEVTAVTPYAIPEPHLQVKIRPSRASSKKAVSPAPVAPASTGTQQLPRLEVKCVEKLGTGAFGTVWKAEDELLQREVAVKFLTSTNETMNEDALLREARSLAKVAHPNLVTVHGAAWLRHPDNHLVAPAIIMELLRGVPLQSWWSRQRERAEVLTCASGVVAGVQAIHAANLHHGDLHSENVMVLDDATAKIIDWRYQDTHLLKPTTARREVVQQDERRANDLVVRLFDKQGMRTEHDAVRHLDDIAELARVLDELTINSRQAAQAKPTSPAPVAAQHHEAELAITVAKYASRFRLALESIAKSEKEFHQGKERRDVDAEIGTLRTAATELEDLRASVRAIFSDSVSDALHYAAEEALFLIDFVTLPMHGEKRDTERWSIIWGHLYEENDQDAEKAFGRLLKLSDLLERWARSYMKGDAPMTSDAVRAEVDGLMKAVLEARHERDAVAAAEKRQATKEAIERIEAKEREITEQIRTQRAAQSTRDVPPQAKPDAEATEPVTGELTEHWHRGTSEPGPDAGPEALDDERSNR